MSKSGSDNVRQCINTGNSFFTRKTSTSYYLRGPELLLFPRWMIWYCGIRGEMLRKTVFENEKFDILSIRRPVSVLQIAPKK